MILTRNSLLAITACALLATGCGPIRDASAANNHMMLVRKNPGTLGYRRLMAKSEKIGDVKLFIVRTGLPDFLAEARSREREYLIFYYLDRREAFACRTRSSRSSEVEFAGPYAMTAGELKLLKAAKRKADQSLAGG